MSLAYRDALKRGLEFFVITLVVTLVLQLGPIEAALTACSAIPAPGVPEPAACAIPWRQFGYGLLAAVVGAIIKTVAQFAEILHDNQPTTVTTTTVAPVAATTTEVTK